MHNLWRAEGREVLGFTKSSRVFSRFYQGYLGFARSSRLFVMFGLKTIYDGKKNVTKTCFLFQKISFVDKNGGFQGHFIWVAEGLT